MLQAPKFGVEAFNLLFPGVHEVAIPFGDPRKVRAAGPVLLYG
jgi:hypothetical protein